MRSVTRRDLSLAFERECLSRFVSIAASERCRTRTRTSLGSSHVLVSTAVVICRAAYQSYRVLSDAQPSDLGKMWVTVLSVVHSR